MADERGPLITPQTQYHKAVKRKKVLSKISREPVGINIYIRWYFDWLPNSAKQKCSDVLVSLGQYYEVIGSHIHHAQTFNLLMTNWFTGWCGFPVVFWPENKRVEPYFSVYQLLTSYYNTSQVGDRIVECVLKSVFFGVHVSSPCNAKQLHEKAQDYWSSVRDVQPVAKSHSAGNYKRTR